MANLNLFLRIMFMALIFSISACSIIETEPTKPEENPPNILTQVTSVFKCDTSNQMCLKIDGNDYTPRLICTVITTFPYNQINVVGSEPDGLKAVSLYFPVDVKVDSFPLQRVSRYVASYSPSFNSTFTLDKGKLIITKHDLINKYVEGRFECIVEDLNAPTQKRIPITEGGFKIKY
jgi:hypothetical protein